MDEDVSTEELVGGIRAEVDLINSRNAIIRLVAAEDEERADHRNCLLQELMAKLGWYKEEVRSQREARAEAEEKLKSALNHLQEVLKENKAKQDLLREEVQCQRKGRMEVEAKLKTAEEKLVSTSNKLQKELEQKETFSRAMEEVNKSHNALNVAWQASNSNEATGDFGSRAGSTLALANTCAMARDDEREKVELVPVMEPSHETAIAEKEEEVREAKATIEVLVKKNRALEGEATKANKRAEEMKKLAERVHQGEKSDLEKQNGWLVIQADQANERAENARNNADQMEQNQQAKDSLSFQTGDWLTKVKSECGRLKDTMPTTAEATGRHSVKKVLTLVSLCKASVEAVIFKPGSTLSIGQQGNRNIKDRVKALPLFARRRTASLEEGATMSRETLKNITIELEESKETCAGLEVKVEEANEAEKAANASLWGAKQTITERDEKNAQLQEEVKARTQQLDKCVKDHEEDTENSRPEVLALRSKLEKAQKHKIPASLSNDGDVPRHEGNREVGATPTTPKRVSSKKKANTTGKKNRRVGANELDALMENYHSNICHTGRRGGPARSPLAKDVFKSNDWK